MTVALRLKIDIMDSNKWLTNIWPPRKRRKILVLPKIRLPMSIEIGQQGTINYIFFFLQGNIRINHRSHLYLGFLQLNALSRVK